MTLALMETGAGDAGEFELDFLGGAGGLAAFGNVLLAGTGSLDHLVARAVPGGEKAVAEVDCGVEDDLGFAVGQQAGVAAVRWDETVSYARLPTRTKRTAGTTRTGRTERTRVPALDAPGPLGP